MPIDWPKDSDAQSDSDTSSLGSYLSDSSFDSEDQSALIQEEWEESMRQIEAVLSVIILPFFGKWWGRRFAFWGKSPSFVIHSGLPSAVSGPPISTPPVVCL